MINLQINWNVPISIAAVCWSSSQQREINEQQISPSTLLILTSNVSKHPFPPNLLVENFTKQFTLCLKIRNFASDPLRAIWEPFGKSPTGHHAHFKKVFFFWSVRHKGLIDGVFHGWLSFCKFLPSERRDSRPHLS